MSIADSHTVDPGSLTGRRYALVSTDTHAGGSIADYRRFLPATLHEQFDAWAAAFTDGWEHVGDDSDENIRLGTSSFMSPVNWLSERRLSDLERDGIVAEVIFPNTVPPFYPSGCLTAPAPIDQADYDLRWAGIQAHNRWLAEFCGQAAGRRIGIAQIFLDDVDATIAEIRWAHANGLRGVLLPGDTHVRVINTYYPRLDPIWEVCEELQMPVHRHGSVVSEAETDETGIAARAIGLLEASLFGQRTFGQFVLSGAFERFPDLQLVYAETGAAWIPDMLARVDGFVKSAGRDGTIPSMFAGPAVAQLTRLPSEYWRTNCHVATFLSDADMSVRDIVGVDRITWGADYPHHEGTFPNTTLALRRNFAGLPEREVRAMTSINAVKLYGLDLDMLQSLGDQFGPTPAELELPLDVSDFPVSPCPTFSAQYAA